MELLINEIINHETGELINTKELLTTDAENIHKMRNRLENAFQLNKKYLVCAYCGQNLKLRSDHNKKYQMHFAHIHDSNDCPIKTDCNLNKTEILALKYNGCKESEAHKRIKNSIYEILCADKRFSNPMTETIIKDFAERKKWRKPDIQCEFNNQKIVLELQLSTTFLSVIVERDIFYKNNDIPLIWIFDKFDPADTRFTDKDIFYNNNCNAFVFDEECYEISKNKNGFYLKVFYCKPTIENEKFIYKWENAIIDFEKLHFKNCKVYFFDYDHEKRKLKYFNCKNKLFCDLEQYNYITPNQFGELLEPFVEYNLTHWTDINDKHILKDIFCVFLSIRKNIIIGFKYKKLIELVNHIFSHRKEVFWMLLEFIEKGGYENIILNSDKNNTYRKMKLKYLEGNFIKEDKYTRYIQYFFKGYF